jgi:murein DD-endopeptidase MepM/ murein hydrolase activator NlpD
MRWFQCLPGTTGDPMADPMADISVFQSPGASGWWGAKFGCYRNNCARRHQGWDLHATSGTEIRAVSAGTITHHTNAGGYGNYILLKTKANAQRTYLYGHLSQREPVGDYCPGDKIGQSGTTGNASADRPHLHFEVRDGGVPVDPTTYLREPPSVVEATGSPTAAIDKSLPSPCNPC